jgi:hypothetical protein
MWIIYLSFPLIQHLCNFLFYYYSLRSTFVHMFVSLIIPLKIILRTHSILIKGIDNNLLISFKEICLPPKSWVSCCFVRVWDTPWWRLENMAQTCYIYPDMGIQRVQVHSLWKLASARLVCHHSMLSLDKRASKARNVSVWVCVYTHMCACVCVYVHTRTNKTMGNSNGITNEKNIKKVQT